LTDPRGTNTQFPLADLVRQSVYSRLAGYEDVNDAERLSHDPTFRLIGSEKIWERGAALTSRVHSFEMELLARDENLAGLAAINRELIARVVVADRSGSTAAEDGEVSEKSPAGAVIPVLAFSGRAERALLGPGLRKPRWNPPIQGVQVHTEDESKSQNGNSGLG
jgi:hypothetical protein